MTHLHLLSEVHAAGRHVGGPHGLDLGDGLEPGLVQQLVVVGDDFVEESQALQPFVVDGALRVKVVEVGAGGEHDCRFVVSVAVQFLGGVVVVVVDGVGVVVRVGWGGVGWGGWGAEGKEVGGRLVGRRLTFEFLFCFVFVS